MFDAVVLAGGGHRCWWQLGWWEEVAPAISLRPAQIAGVSAGAASACVLYANTAQVALDYYRRVLVSGSRNFYPGRLFTRGVRMMPHEQIYRGALEFLLGGEAFDRLVRTAPAIHIMIARPPGWLPATAAVGMGLAAYNLEKYWRRPLHPVFGVRLGFRPEVVSVQSCQSAQALIDLIIASSSTPPMTSLQRIGGKVVLDGGLIDNVPVNALQPSEGNPPGRMRTLVLVTRRYPKFAPVFKADGRVYVQPSQPVAASSWDYTNPDAYQKTYDQGRRDAAAFLQWVKDNGQEFA